MKNFNQMVEQQMSKVNGGVAIIPIIGLVTGLISLGIGGANLALGIKRK